MQHPEFLTVQQYAQKAKISLNCAYTKLFELLIKNKSCLFDDFFFEGCATQKAVMERFCAYCDRVFWVVCPKCFEPEIAGIIWLSDFVGNPPNPISAHVSVCFARKYWGAFVNYSAQKFIKILFEKFRFVKLFAEVYSDNINGLKFVERMGFGLVGYNLFNTKRDGKFTHCLLYAIFNPRFVRLCEGLGHN